MPPGRSEPLNRTGVSLDGSPQAGRGDGTIRLVGATISAQGALHVQSFAFATDRVGLSLIRPVFRCSAVKVFVVLASELGMSGRVLEAGYGIASQLSAYDGVDFSRGGPVMNAMVLNPAIRQYFVDVLPVETMFVKCSGAVVEKYKFHASALSRALFYPVLEALTDLSYAADRRPDADAVVMSALAAGSASELEVAACLTPFRSAFSEVVTNALVASRMSGLPGGFEAYVQLILGAFSRCAIHA